MVTTTDSGTKMRARITSREDSGQLSDEFTIFYGDEQIFKVHPTSSGFLDVHLRNGWELSVWPDGYLAVNIPNGSGGTKTGMIIRQDRIEYYLPMYDRWQRNQGGVTVATTKKVSLDVWGHSNEQAIVTRGEVKSRNLEIALIDIGGCAI